LVCRYCGSDDLAPSFKKRRDARCRACFKQRYGSTSRGKHDKPAGKSESGKVVKDTAGPSSPRIRPPSHLPYGKQLELNAC
jgi:hypothetical protein